VGWVILAIAVLVILLTEGRYFGKGLLRWVYDRAGPAMFGARSEAAQWRRLIERLGLCTEARVLDVGTAVGDLPLTVAARPGFRGQAVGVDWSPRMIDRANREAQRRALHDRVTFRVVDIRQGLPFEDGSFDVVFCLGLLESLPRPGQALAGLARVLAPGGTMVLSLYQRGWSSKVAVLSLSWYERHLDALGLDSIEVAPCRRSQDAIIARATEPPRLA
jgi:ubiquinone/menaquinone biosynthesis C-methylase UbiE